MTAASDLGKKRCGRKIVYSMDLWRVLNGEGKHGAEGGVHDEERGDA